MQPNFVVLKPKDVIKVYQLIAHGRWFSPGTPASSITKTGRHDIAEILLKVVLNTKNQKIKIKTLVILKDHFLFVPMVTSYYRFDCILKKNPI
jgi:hypothetical protein